MDSRTPFHSLVTESFDSSSSSYAKSLETFIDQVKSNSSLISDLYHFKSFDPMSDPFDDWECKFDGILSDGYDEDIGSDDDEVTESKIKDFFDDKALELRKLQTPLYDEFYNSLNAAIPSLNFSERQIKWREELDQELEKKREMMHQRKASVGVKTSSPKDEALIGRKRIASRKEIVLEGTYYKCDFFV